MIVLGATGMLGKAVVNEAKKNNINVVGVARNSTDIDLDVLDFKRLRALVKVKKPKIILNCVAITNIDLCEESVKESYLVNSHLVAILVDICREYDIYLIHISTDHYYINDINKKHKETSAIVLINNYSKTKFAGEMFALSYLKSLVIRTNIVGFRDKGKHTFVEWVLSSLENDKKITLFKDFYTSSIDVHSFSKLLFKIINNKEAQLYGLVNIASSEVCSKEVFIKKLASVFNYKNLNYKIGGIASIQGARRAESLGLDTSKIERLLGVNMPTTNQVISELYKNWKQL
ncbi:SDR family oxidoreductase [bacterium]|jgi:dTDP-4-dehydrorhamnose reductase|nr:SDR family oxidoreductase [bacterium]